MKKDIRQSIFEATVRLGWDLSIDSVSVEYPPKETMGEYSTNVAFGLAKKLCKAPIAIAQELAGAIQDDRFEKVMAVAPGYVNIFLKKSVLQQTVRDVLSLKEVFGNSDMGKGVKILLEFVSSNPTGPIHLGNARGGPLGSVLAEVLKKTGHVVRSEFYVNDFGNQVEILGHSILGDEYKQYGGAYIAELAKEKPETLTDPRETGMWAAEKILREMIRPTCERMGVVYDDFFSEKSLHDSGKVQDMVAFLKEKGLVYEKENALWYQSTRFGDDKDRVLVKSNGKTTYRLADFAYHKDKFDRGFDRLVTVLGADHHSEAKEMAVFIERILGKRSAYQTILTQFVRVTHNGEEVKMSKRKGTYYAMDDLLEEVGRDAVRFIFLSYAATTHLHFDINLALEQSEKNPVFYVQYAHARMASIIRKANDSGIAVSLETLDALTHEKELRLLKKFLEFPDMLVLVAETFETHRLPQYARELADAFHSFYDVCRIVGEEDARVASARLALVCAVKEVLAETLRLCGVSAPDKM